ncbi:PP2C family protein-serine/threonine phosphatase [Sediminitomix flava]|uniref:Serine phosphatase RsbU (Regulator of sigma subunit) n=1 Tax=Sediminitomix flava TaxID=379075 RepID=A0A315Z7M1_SEDFL|nr:SpoIIE family protein phosphatase [Sediminitomix flava]PWJ38601.1 serine phosphatase RsbU (regulator of sigma subunit) [Sediminitomix flava]
MNQEITNNYTGLNSISNFIKSQENKKRELFKGSMIVIAISCVLYVVLMYFVEYFSGAIIASTIGTAMIGLIFLNKRNILKEETLHTIYPILLHSLILGIICTSGGVKSPGTVWYGGVFTESFFYGGLKKGRISSGFAIVALIFISILEFSGVQIPNHLNPNYVEVITYPTYIGFLACLIYVLYTYQKWNVDAQNSLKDLTDEILTQNEELNQQKEEISSQNEHLANFQKLMYSSLNYGRKIQTSVFNYTKELKSVFKDSFVYQRPRNIVSGDFYWFQSIDDKHILVVTDCTGHGVPSAFLTLLASSYLKKIIDEQQITDPSLILQQMNRLILDEFNEERNEGMDMGIAVFDLKKEKLVYSGAKVPLYQVRDGNIQEIKGSVYPIGDARQLDKKYETINIDLRTEDTYYLASDGFQDQFGGDKDRKFMKKKFRELLHSYEGMSMNVQRRRLEQTYNSWKGSQSQTDDIIVVGVKI